MPSDAQDLPFPPSMPERARAVASALRNRIHWGLHSATMRVGDRLPSVRDIAAEFRVDARTALRACQELEQEGLIERRARSGMYVCAVSTSLPPLHPRAETIVHLLSLGLDYGIAPADLATRMTETFSPEAVRVACVDSNADHAEAMCDMLTSTFGVTANTGHPNVAATSRTAAE